MKRLKNWILDSPMLLIILDWIDEWLKRRKAGKDE